MNALPDRPAEILWRSTRELVLWKPAGRSCELPGAAQARSILGELRRSLGSEELRLVHRLDRLACGRLLVALDREAAAHHAAAFRERRVLKAYLARVEGDPRGLLGEQRAYLRRVGAVAKVVRSGGDPASMELLACSAAPGRPGQHHLLIELGSGRFHQIRAMLAHLGHPLAGDELYGGGEGDPPWLESAVLAFECAADGARLVLGGGEEPRREPISEEIRACLGRIAERARG